MGAAQAVAQGAAPRTRGAGAGASDGAAAPGPTQAGDPAGIGIAHRNAPLRASAMGRVPAARRASPFAARLGPDSLTTRPSARRSTSTEPSWSVRRTRAPLARNRSSVDRAGWPYGLPAPAEAIATRGWTASTNAWVDAVALPWWAILTRSTRGSPRASSVGSMPCSTSPISRNRRPFASPRNTTETLLIPVPVSGGSSGTAPGSGHRTDSRTSPRRICAPVARRPRGGPSWRTAFQAAHPGPGPCMPGSYTRPTW